MASRFNLAFIKILSTNDDKSRPMFLAFCVYVIHEAFRQFRQADATDMYCLIFVMPIFDA